MSHGGWGPGGYGTMSSNVTWEGGGSWECHVLFEWPLTFYKKIDFCALARWEIKSEIYIS